MAGEKSKMAVKTKMVSGGFFLNRNSTETPFSGFLKKKMM
jgi:hypothetical protein